MVFHFLFEQSGTFKNEALKLGFNAFDYDILNDFGNTDYEIDLFLEIDKAYNGEPSIFDSIKEEDCVMAFFPCIRFSCQQQLNFMGNNYAMRNWSLEKKLEHDIKAHNELNQLYNMISKLVLVCLKRHLKLVIENPYQTEHYLYKYWCIKPSVIDVDRSLHGDFYKKPTQYWFIGFQPEERFHLEPQRVNQKLKKVETASRVERSMISSEYARWFLLTYLCDVAKEDLIDMDI